MPVSLATTLDWNNVESLGLLINAIVGGIVYWYTKETQKLRRGTEQQLSVAHDQVAREKEQMRLAMMPYLTCSIRTELSPRQRAYIEQEKASPRGFPPMLSGKSLHIRRLPPNDMSNHLPNQMLTLTNLNGRLAHTINAFLHFGTNHPECGDIFLPVADRRTWAFSQVLEGLTDTQPQRLPLDSVLPEVDILERVYGKAVAAKFQEFLDTKTNFLAVIYLDLENRPYIAKRKATISPDDLSAGVDGPVEIIRC